MTISRNGFTDAPLQWQPWLAPLVIEEASDEQLAVLDESGGAARQSPYYLTLAHAPAMLRERSRVYNDIMYVPAGLPRKERELASVVVSRINGCVYCTSVHARRYEQIAKRTDIIEELFDNPHNAGFDDRERIIINFCVRLTESPNSIDANDMIFLRSVGLEPMEILDLIHTVSIFAWANRLMLNLGEAAIPPE